MSKWRVDIAGEKPAFIVKLLGATLSKMEEMHRRKLTPEEIRVGVERALARARRDVQHTPPAELSEEVSVMVRDSDLAELNGRVVGPTSGVPR